MDIFKETLNGKVIEICDARERNNHTKTNIQTDGGARKLLKKKREEGI